jgi:hypothetical protein
MTSVVPVRSDGRKRQCRTLPCGFSANSEPAVQPFPTHYQNFGMHISFQTALNSGVPKFRSFDKAEPDSQFRGKYIRKK